MSEPAPERTPQPRKGGTPAKPKGKENVFTRKIGPLPMWVWVAIIAGLIIVWALWKGRSSSSSGSSGSGGGGKTGGFGRYLQPPEVITRTITRRGRGSSGGGSSDDDEDFKSHPAKRRDRDEDEDERKHHHKGSTKHRGRRNKDHDEDEDERERNGHAHPMIRVRAATRGAAAPGQLSAFKTNSRGDTPSLQQVADGFSTSPDAIIQESTGRGVPHGPAWNRYVQQGDFDQPLPHGVDMAILDRTQ